MLAWLVMALLLVPVQGPRAHRTYPTGSNANQRQNPPKEPASLGPIRSGQTAPQGKQATARGKEGEKPLRPILGALIDSWPLTLIGIGALWLTWRTIGTLERQAEAALLNAEAVIKAERPWLIVQIEASENEAATYLVVATNKGRTPAEMVDGLFGQGVYPIGDSVPNEDRMAPFFAPLQGVTVPGDSFEVGKIKITSHRIDNSTPPPKQLYCCGIIRYWDTFTDRSQAAPYVTQWCFHWQGPKREWVRSPNGYSRNT